DAVQESVAVPARLAKRSARVAVSASRGIPRRHYRHHHTNGVVNHLERSARGTSEPEPDDEPRKSTMVFSRVAGNVGLFRSVDRRRGHAHADHHWTDGDSLY